MIVNTIYVEFGRENKETDTIAIHRSKGPLNMADVLRFHASFRSDDVIQIHFYNGTDCFILHDWNELCHAYENSRDNGMAFGFTTEN